MELVLLTLFCLFSLGISIASLTYSIKLHIAYKIFMDSTQTIPIPANPGMDLDRMTDELFKASAESVGYPASAYDSTRKAQKETFRAGKTQDLSGDFNAEDLV